MQKRIVSCRKGDEYEMNLFSKKKKSIRTNGKRFDFFNPQFGVMNVDSCSVIFFDIISLLARDCEYNLVDCYFDSNRLFISGICNQQKNELMLRYLGSDEELVIARVCFINKRKGNMTELFSILQRIQEKYNTGDIVIESVMTQEMEEWCHKNGFIRKGTSKDYYIKRVV